jgi:hypothetical protein
MRRSMRFYRDVLGMEIVFGGEDAFFSSLRAKDGSVPILNLEEGHSVPDCVRMIFYVADVDAFWEYLRGDIFICLIRIATGCRLHARSSSLSAVARTHPVRVHPRHVLEFP